MAIYLLHGDPYQVEQRVKQLTVGVDLSWASFNLQTVKTVQEAITESRTLPFGSGDRVVICPTTLFTTKDKKDDDLLQLLQDNVSAIPETNTLIFTAEKVDSRLKSTKWAKSEATIEEFPVLTPWDMAGIQALVTTIGNRLNIPVSQSVAEYLASVIGADAYRIESELTKLAPQGPITVEMVKSMVQGSTQTSLDLADAIVAGDRSKAFGLLHPLLTQGNHPLQIIATLIGRFEKLFTVAYAPGSNDEVAKMAGVGNPRQVYYLKQDAQRMGDRLIRILPLLLDAETNIKSGHEPRMELERLVAQC